MNKHNIFTIFFILTMSAAIQAAAPKNEMAAKFLFKNGLADFERTTFKTFIKEMNAKAITPTEKDCKNCELQACVQDGKTQVIAHAETMDSLVKNIELSKFDKAATLPECAPTKNNLSQFLPLKLGAKINEAKKFLGEPVKESPSDVLWCYNTFRKASAKEQSTNYPEGKWISISNEVQLTVTEGVVSKISLLRTSELNVKGESSEVLFQKSTENCDFRKQ